MSEEPTWDDYLNAYLGPLKEKIDGLEETIKLIKEKMIKPNSDSIEKLEKTYSYLNTNRHLNKRMDGWISQIIIYKKDIDDKIYDINTQISELKEQFYGKVDLFENWLLKHQDVLREFLGLFEETHDDSITRESFTILLKRLSGATDKKLEGEKEYIASLNDPKAFEGVNLGELKRTRKTESKPSYGCFLFTYCSECIVAFDDCKIKGIQQVVVEKEDLEKAIVHGCIICYDSEECEKGRINKEVCDIWNLKKYIGGKRIS